MPDEAWVAEMVSAWNAFDGEKIGSLFAPDGVWRDEALGSRLEGRDRIIEMWGTNAPAWAPDFHLDLIATVCSDDTYAFEWRMTGTTKRGGTAFNRVGASVGHLRDGLIVEHADYYNGADFPH